MAAHSSNAPSSEGGFFNITEECFKGKPFDKIALILLHDVDEAHSWSYGEMYEKIEKLSTGLSKLRLKPFSRILIRSENNFDFFLLYFAAMHASLVPCVLDPTQTKHELLLSIQEAKPLLYYESNGLALNPVLPKYCRKLTEADLEDLKATIAEEEAPPTNANDPAFLIFTAGSNSVPKGIIHAHRTIDVRKSICQKWCQMGEKDVVFHTASHHLAYTLGINFFDTWAQGGTAVSFLGTPTPYETLQIIQKYDVTLLASVPAFYKEMLHLSPEVRDRFSRTSLRGALSAEELLGAVIQREWEELFRVPLLQGFTITEMHLPLTDSLEFPRKYGSLGKPHNGCPLEIHSGILALPVNHPSFMLATTQGPFHGKWYMTEDLVSCDQEGYFWHHGRKGEILKTHGSIRVSAQEIEEVFRHHEHVLEVAAVTTPNEKGEEILTLFVVPYQVDEEENIFEKRLLDYAKKELSILKLPERFVFLEHLPKQANGMIDRGRLHLL